MRRVLQITGGMNRGGLETLVMNIYRNIDRSKLQFDFLIYRDQADYRNEIEDLGGKIFVLPARRDGIKHYYALFKFFKEHANDYVAVHLHIPSLSSIHSLLYAKIFGVKIRVLHSHNSTCKGYINKILHHFYKNFVSLLATDYLGCSDKSIEWFYSNTSVFSKAVMVNNGIDIKKFVFNEGRRTDSRKQLGLDTDCLLIGHIGRFDTQKNHVFLIDIIEALSKIDQHFKVILIGTGPLYESIISLSEEKKLSNYIIFAGVRSDIEDLLQAIDIVVMPSLHEGLPVSLVEAQASSLPVLASDTISNDARLTDNYYSMSLSESAEKWAEQIINIINNYQRNDVSGVLVEKGFDIQVTKDYIVSIYDRN